MSMLRTLLVVGAALLLLPVDAKKQAEFSATASRAAAETATFCERNIDTCATGRELWGLLIQKAEYAIDLGARLIRAEIARSRTSEESTTPSVHAPQLGNPYQQQEQWHASRQAPYAPLPAAVSSTGERNNSTQVETSSRWR